MSILDKVIASMTPPESEEARAEARSKARELAGRHPWLELVLQHHLAIEAAFGALKRESTAQGRRLAEKTLAGLLTGHSLAEEGVLYPAMAHSTQKAHATSAYTQQSGAKINLAALEVLDPMTQDYLDKVEHVEGAVAHHMYEEEGTWFPTLCEDADLQTHERLTRRYAEEYARYMGRAFA